MNTLVRPRVAALMACTGVAALACAPGAAAAGDPIAERRVVQVKFNDGTEVSAKSRKLVFSSAALQRRVDGAFSGAAVVATRPVFSQRPAELDAQRRALRAKGKDVSDLTSFMQVEFTDEAQARAALARLGSAAGVETASIQHSVATADVSDGIGSFSAADIAFYQGTEWSAAPNGNGLAAAQSIPGIRGEYASYTAVDSGLLPHVDVPGIPADQNTDPSVLTVANAEHGGYTVGVALARRDGVGIDGVVPDASARFQGQNWADGGPASISAAVLTAAGRMPAGGVLVAPLALVTDGRHLPLDNDPATFEAIQYATAMGITVVLPAGNTPENLDVSVYNATQRRLGDSGAVIVGAGSPAPECSALGTYPTRSRIGFSAYGSRVDVQGPGMCVPAPHLGTDYAGYSGTSSASATVAALSTAVSSAYTAYSGHAITPAALRDALKATATPQDVSSPGALDGNIGGLPNVPAAVEYALRDVHPSIAITSPSASAQVPAGASVSVRLRATNASSLDHAECRADGGAWVACGSPWTSPALNAPGDHTLEARAIDRWNQPQATAAKITVTAVPTWPAAYAVDGSATMPGLLESSVAVLGGAELDVDSMTGLATPWLSLPAQRVGLIAAGTIPLTGDVAFVPSGTQSAAFVDGRFAMSLRARIRLVKAYMFGTFPVELGTTCQTTSLSTIPLSSAPGAFTPAAGGLVTATYGMSDFSGCGALNGNINTATASTDNTMSLTLTPTT